MGRYFNPPTYSAIEDAGGRPLQLGDHAFLLAQLQPGESLGIYLDRFMFLQIADVTDPEEYREFWVQVESGSVILLGFFALPEDAFHPPKRRPIHA